MLPNVQDTAPSVAQYVRSCLDDFQATITSLSVAQPCIKSKLHPDAISDELGRFRIWSGEVGAHRSGQESLDYKLREASHIRETIIRLLQNTTTSLGKVQAIIREEKISWEDMTDSDSDTSTGELEDDGRQQKTELGQLLSKIADINTCLMRLSMSIRNPAPHEQSANESTGDATHLSRSTVSKRSLDCGANERVSDARRIWLRSKSLYAFLAKGKK